MKSPILTVQIEAEADVVAVRQKARDIADLIGFERLDQTRIATAVSEVARNFYNKAGGGQAEFLIESNSAQQTFVIRIVGSRREADGSAAALTSSEQSRSSIATGLVGAKRLIDRFNATSEANGEAIIELGQIIPSDIKPVTKARLADIARAASENQSGDPLTILREQNRELMQSLEEIRRRQEETKQLSRELSDTNRGVVALYAELDERAEQLRRASEAKSRFLSNMSHEFRTPLNSIMALSRLLSDGTDGELGSEQEKQVGYIRRSAEGLLELVNDLLDLAKVEAGKVEVKPVAFMVTELFGALRGALKPLQANPAVDLIFEIKGPIPELFTDEAKVSQILRNLISNALKFTEAGEVRVSATYDADLSQLTFSVSDTGIGIAPQHRQRIFEEFGQIETPLHGRVKGTGLGLPLSRNLAVLLGGDISVESVPGQGSVFSFVIPVCGVSEDNTQRGTNRTRKHVLVIDDDETFRYVFRHLIGDNSSFELIEADGGEQGLSLARRDLPDLIFLDLQMPHLDGFSVLKELRADSATSAIPVVISTSLAINQELREKLPQDIRILSKKDLSREKVSNFLREIMEKGLRA